jgi:hypothetical protein
MTPPSLAAFLTLLQLVLSAAFVVITIALLRRRFRPALFGVVEV